MAPSSAVPAGMSAFADLFAPRSGSTTPPPSRPAESYQRAVEITGGRSALEIATHGQPDTIELQALVWSWSIDVLVALARRRDLRPETRRALAYRCQRLQSAAGYQDPDPAVRALLEDPELPAALVALLAPVAAGSDDTLLTFLTHPRARPYFVFELLSRWSGLDHPHALRARRAVALLAPEPLATAAVLSAIEVMPARKLRAASRRTISRLGGHAQVGTRVLAGLAAEWSGSVGDLEDAAVLVGRPAP